MINPLLQTSELPLFNQIEPQHVVPAIRELLADNRKAVEQLLNNDKPYTFENLIIPLEALNDRLHSVWGVVSHLSSVCDNPALREVYDLLLPELSEYYTEMGQNKGLHKAYLSLSESREYADYSNAQRTIVENGLRDFRLSGILLSKAHQEQYKTLNMRLSELENKFDHNVLDATSDWYLEITDESRLKGIPERALSCMCSAASSKNIEGKVVTLDFACYDAIMTYAEDRDLRKTIYTAYTTLASDQGPGKKEWDNTAIIEQIVELRLELAKLLGFKNYAEYSLETKMLKNPAEVIGFLNEVAHKVKKLGQKELEELKQFALKNSDLEKLEPWDVRYISEKYRLYQGELSQEELRNYFPEEKVLEGLFKLANQLYGITIREIKNIEVWHPSVRFFEVTDKNNQLRGKFYLDLFTRPHKRHGAWCGDCRSRFKEENGHLQLPVAYIVANFASPAENAEAYFSFDEVITLFHEFGHCLQHVLTVIDYPSIAGGNGVEWDAIELPSQLMENWCWEPAVMDNISKHKVTGEPLSKDLFQTLIKNKNFQVGLRMLRQLEFALFDFKLHMQSTLKHMVSAQEILNEVRSKVAATPFPSFNRMQNSFSHIFSGGYAAGYYSYLWSEVLSSDVFDVFEEKGIFNASVGELFLNTVLEQGGSKPAMELFIEFRGRKPVIEPLLRHHGLTN